MSHHQTVKGIDVDEQTRCRHYHSQIDRIAIKFYCCGEYYPCFECHEAVGCGNAAVWPEEHFDEKAILCGACGSELAIREYLKGDSSCPACEAPFNPGCKLHRHLYFSA